MYPKALEELMLDLQRLPGVGTKSAERYAFEMLQWEEEDIVSFAQHVLNVKQQITYCKICGNLSDHKECNICSSDARNKKTLCVVSYPKDIIAIEKAQLYQGVYHVLGGVISTSKGIYPEDLKIDGLLERISQGEIEEVIMAISPTVEGETTSLYLAKLLESYPVEITRIAHGLPMGGQLDYADELTLYKAFEGRLHIK
ncbi:MAG: recombination mediator RecR [Erysipelotrichaceae bacterium]